MNPDLQQAIDAGTISAETAKKLETLPPDCFCSHKDWGIGKIREWRILTNQILIDFDSKKNHPMQLVYASTTLSPIPEQHIHARARRDPAKVASDCDLDPVSTVRSILLDFGKKATADQIASTLVPFVFSPEKFKRWWDSAKKALKKDGHFILPQKRTDPVELVETQAAVHTTLLAKFRAAKQLKDQVAAVEQFVKTIASLNDPQEVEALIPELEKAAEAGIHVSPPQATELLLLRDEILASCQLSKKSFGPSVAGIIQKESARLLDLFAELPPAKQRALLDSMEEAFDSQWTERSFSLMLKAPARLVEDIGSLFVKKNAQDLLQTRLQKWIRERKASSDILFWICKRRETSQLSLVSHELFDAVLASLESDQISGSTKGTKLRSLLSEDPRLLTDFFENAPKDILRNSVRRLLASSAFEKDSLRSFLSRLKKKYPDIKDLEIAETEQAEESLIVSQPSLDLRKKEFDHLVNNLIPQNLRDIQVARGYGDLRENFEFKSAKDQQRVLSQRKSDLGKALATAKITDFKNPDTTQVSIGTVVSLKDSASGKSEEYTILGAWDSAPDKGIVSYKATIAEALLGAKTGEERTLPDSRRVRVEKIAPFKNLDLLAGILQASSENTPAS